MVGLNSKLNQDKVESGNIELPAISIVAYWVLLIVLISNQKEKEKSEVKEEKGGIYKI